MRRRPLVPAKKRPSIPVKEREREGERGWGKELWEVWEGGSVRRREGAREGARERGNTESVSE